MSKFTHYIDSTIVIETEDFSVFTLIADEGVVAITITSSELKEIITWIDEHSDKPNNRYLIPSSITTLEELCELIDWTRRVNHIQIQKAIN